MRQYTGGVWENVPLETSTSLKGGDCFKINFKTNQDCFVYVLLYGSGGIADTLFPRKEISLDNNVKGDRLYSLPDGGNWYYLDNVPGTETIYLVACYEPMKNIAGVLAKMERADPGRKRGFSRDIQQEISSIQTRGLESDRFVFSQRGISGIAPKPTWNLTHEGSTIEAVTEVVQGAGSIKIVSFEHK